MSRRKIPSVSNSLTPKEKAFISGGMADEVTHEETRQETEAWIALNMLVPKRIKNEMKAYKEYGGFKRIGDLQQLVWEFFKENHQSNFQSIKDSFFLENLD